MNNTPYLAHHGVKGMKWGVRRYRNYDGTLTDAGRKRYASGDTQRSGDSDRAKRALVTGVKVAAVVLAAYGAHKLINDPRAIAAGKAALETVAGRASGLRSAVQGSSEYKIAKGAANVAKKGVAVVGGDKVRSTLTAVSATATTALLLRTQVKDLRSAIAEDTGDRYGKAMEVTKSAADIGLTVTDMANGSTSRSKRGAARSSNAEQRAAISSVVGAPKGMFGADDMRRYNALFARNPTDEQRAVIKSLRKQGYGVDQIEQYVYHSACMRENRSLMDDTTYLAHYGVKGMRWGVRKKYRNFSGTYTKAGVKRFDESDRKYQNAKANYKAVKKSDASKYDRRMAKAKVKSAKAELKADYKHLALDKAGDYGKVRYKQGERIRKKQRVSRRLGTISGLAAAGAAWAVQARAYGYSVDDRVVAGLAGTSVVFAGASFVSRLITSKPNTQLRAFYNHTSNYKRK